LRGGSNDSGWWQAADDRGVDGVNAGKADHGSSSRGGDDKRRGKAS